MRSHRSREGQNVFVSVPSELPNATSTQFDILSNPKVEASVIDGDTGYPLLAWCMNLEAIASLMTDGNIH